MANVEDKIKPELLQFRDYLIGVGAELKIGRLINWIDALLEDAVPTSSNDYQNPRHYFPGLTDLPWHDAVNHPTCKALEEHASQIAAEYFATGEGHSLGAYTQPDSSFIEGTEWRAAILKRWDQRLEEAASYPKTFSLLADDPGVAEIIMFSVVQAGGRIRPHCGPWNLRLTVHLALKIPENTWIRVGSEKRGWEPGRCLVFDDSFEHEVANESDKSRVILLVDLWHPDLTSDERLVVQPALMLLDDDYNGTFKAADAISLVAERLKKAA